MITKTTYVIEFQGEEKTFTRKELQDFSEMLLIAAPEVFLELLSEHTARVEKRIEELKERIRCLEAGSPCPLDGICANIENRIGRLEEEKPKKGIFGTPW